MENITLNVNGMSCGHCVSSVENSVGKIEGVSSVKVDLDAAKVAVEFDTAKTSQQAIASEIEDQGYDVV